MIEIRELYKTYGQGSAAVHALAAVDLDVVVAAAQPSFLAAGRVEPLGEEVKVGAELDGKLARVLVDEGDMVRRGRKSSRPWWNSMPASRCRWGCAWTHSWRWTVETGTVGHPTSRHGSHQFPRGA